MKRAIAFATLLACGGRAVAPAPPPKPPAAVSAPSAVASVAPVASAAPDAGRPTDADDASAAMRTMRISALSWSEHDPEGGYSSIEVFASGYVDAAGHRSCCGYRPRMATGVYRVTKMDALQRLFDDAAASLALHEGEPREPPDRGGFGMHSDSHAVVDGASKPLASMIDTSELGLVALRSRPADLDVAKVQGRVPASRRVVRVLFSRSLDDVPRLSRAQVELVIAQLRARVAHDRDQGFLDWIGEALGKVDASALDLVPPLLSDPRFLPADTVVEALGAHGAAARPWARAVHDVARKSDATLIAAAVALARIGGDDANKWVDDELVPALSGTPKEPNLDLYYRVRFAEALAAIDRPSAKRALDQRVAPLLRARLDAAMK